MRNGFQKFISGKGFYLALAVCLAGAGAAAWVAVDKTIENIETTPLSETPQVQQQADSAPAEQKLGQHRPGRFALAAEGGARGFHLCRRGWGLCPRRSEHEAADQRRRGRAGRLLNAGIAALCTARVLVLCRRIGRSVRTARAAAVLGGFLLDAAGQRRGPSPPSAGTCWSRMRRWATGAPHNGIDISAATGTAVTRRQQTVSSPASTATRCGATSSR